jgi:MFS family permease
MKVVDESAPGRSTKVIVAATLGNMIGVTPVMNATFGLFLIPVSKSFGWPSSIFAGAFALQSLIALFVYPLAGGMADRLGARRIVVVGNLCLALAVAAMGLCGSWPPEVFILCSLVGVAGCFPSTVVLSKIVNGWFRTNRGLVLGVTAGLGVGGGCAIMPRLAQPLIDTLGWRQTFFVLGALILVVGQTLFFFLLREAPSQPAPETAMVGAEAQGWSAAEVRRSPVFWLLSVAVALGTGVVSAMFAFVVPMGMHNHVAPAVSVWALTSISLTNSLWQVAMGRWLDRSQAPRFAALLLLLALAGVGVIFYARTATAFILGGALIGIGAGAEYALLPYALQRYFGMRAYGEIYGLVQGGCAISMGVAPLVLAALYDATATYAWAMALVAVVLVACAALLLKLPTYVVFGASAKGRSAGRLVGAPAAPLAQPGPSDG